MQNPVISTVLTRMLKSIRSKTQEAKNTGSSRAPAIRWGGGHGGPIPVRCPGPLIFQWFRSCRRAAPVTPARPHPVPRDPPCSHPILKGPPHHDPILKGPPHPHSILRDPPHPHSILRGSPCPHPILKGPPQPHIILRGPPRLTLS